MIEFGPERAVQQTASSPRTAGKNNVLIAGKTYRLAQQLQLGQRTRVVLQADAAGESKSWLEIVISPKAESGPAAALNDPN